MTATVIMASQDKQHFWISLGVLPLTLSSFLLLPRLLGLLEGYVCSFIIYWTYCLLHGFFLKGSMTKLYRLPDFSGPSLLLSLLCFVPAMGAFWVAFMPNLDQPSIGLLAIVLLVSLLNGFVEEFYWRAAYISRYRQHFRYAFLLPALMFGGWHVSVWAAPGILYQGGFGALVGGAFFMGLLWGYTAYRQQRVLVPTLAHILTNFFAFSGLLLDNFVH